METHPTHSVLTPFQRVRSVLVNSLGVSPDELAPDTKLRELIVDSLEMAQVILDLEDELDAEIPEDDWAKLFTVSDLTKYV